MGKILILKMYPPCPLAQLRKMFSPQEAAKFPLDLYVVYIQLQKDLFPPILKLSSRFWHCARRSFLNSLIFSPSCPLALQHGTVLLPRPEKYCLFAVTQLTLEKNSNPTFFFQNQKKKNDILRPTHRFLDFINSYQNYEERSIMCHVCIKN